MPDILDVGFAFGMPGGNEWIIILIIALLLFGKRSPEIMRGLGGSVKEFKKGMDEGVSPPVQTPSAPPVDGAVSRNPSPPAQPNKNPPSN